MRGFRASRFAAFALLALLFASAACREQGTGVEVKSLRFTGLQAVSAGQLRSILSTTQSEWLPWGQKFFFDRSQFEADLLRIVAFYGDRGFPAARVKSYNVQLSD